jgi:hypothetical protein
MGQSLYCSKKGVDDGQDLNPDMLYSRLATLAYLALATSQPAQPRLNLN